MKLTITIASDHQAAIEARIRAGAQIPAGVVDVPTYVAQVLKDDLATKLQAFLVAAAQNGVSVTAG